jgi:hypothetical protein
MADIDGIIARRKQRWRQCFDPNAPAGHLFLIRYDPEAPVRPPPNPEHKQARIEWAWERYQRHRQRLEWLDDDSIPYLDVYTGTELFAEAFGCRVQRSDEAMPFALPLIKSPAEVAQLPVPDLNARPLALVFDIAAELRQRAGPEAAVKLVDIQSPMDIAALIWDKTSFYTAMIDAPEAIRELAHKVKQLLTAFLDEWFARFGTEYIAHYPDYFMSGGITLSEDEVGGVSEEMFARFFLPELVELSGRYGGLGMHCCAHARHQWNQFRQIPDLRLLNLVQPETRLQEAYDFFADHVPQMHSWCGQGAPWEWPAQYKKEARVVLQPAAADADEARRVADRLRPLCAPNS